MENLSSNYDNNAAGKKDLLNKKIHGLMGTRDVGHEAEQTMESLFKEYITRKVQIQTFEVSSQKYFNPQLHIVSIENEDYSEFKIEYNAMLSIGWEPEGKTYLKTDKFFQAFKKK